MSILQVVVGAQFGSEAKGHVAQDLLFKGFQNGNTTVNVRVAGPNAGHTAYNNQGRKFPLRQVPVGAVIPGCGLFIAAGSEVDCEVLLHEIDLLEEAGHSVGGRLFVDGQATVLTEGHKQAEATENLVAKLGSTGKGIGAARADRIMRTAKVVEEDSGLVNALRMRDVVITDTASLLHSYLKMTTSQVLIEGTQGYGLGLHAGFYPKCTSSDCRAVDFLAMAGISPWQFEIYQTEVWVVARTFPIRVAGDSGPMYAETSWAALDLPEERTTVTQKVRRVGHWDGSLVRRAVRGNGGAPVARVALTMLDQAVPEIAGATDWSQIKNYTMVLNWIDKVVNDAGAPVRYIGTGPQTGVFL